MRAHLPHAVQLQGQRAEVILADQGVDVLLDVADKLLPRRQLVRSAHLPPGRQDVQQTFRQQRHGTAPLKQEVDPLHVHFTALDRGLLHETKRLCLQSSPR